jgi:two-component system sensor histidine kinase BaeS
MAERFTAQELSLELELQPAWVDGDPDRLRQVIANLLDNALRYTESGGSVTVSVGPHEGRARLRVADTGIGIDRDDLPFVFTRFWRGERSRSRSTGGAGIGLAIAQELVRAHGGHIEVASEPGKGSLFTVSLPLAGAPLSGAGA